MLISHEIRILHLIGEVSYAFRHNELMGPLENIPNNYTQVSHKILNKCFFGGCHLYTKPTSSTLVLTKNCPL